MIYCSFRIEFVVLKDEIFHQLKTHTYLCPCGADLVVLGEQKFWWRECTDDNPPKNVNCCSCSLQLKFDWLLEFRGAMEQLDQAFDVGGEYSSSGEIHCRFMKVNSSAATTGVSFMNVSLYSK